MLRKTTINPYIALLKCDKPASAKFWHLEERIKKDKKYPGVIVEMNKRTAVYNIVTLLRDGVIQEEDLAGFSGDLKAHVNLLLQI